jgi:hypothetical protein
VHEVEQVAESQQVEDHQEPGLGVVVVECEEHSLENKYEGDYLMAPILFIKDAFV